MNTASRMGSSTEPVRIEMPPKFGQRMDAEEGWLEAKNQNNVIRRIYMGDRLDSIEDIVDKYCGASSPAKSKLYIGLGFLFIVFAVIGIWVPGWPTVSSLLPEQPKQSLCQGGGDSRGDAYTASLPDCGARPS